MINNKVKELSELVREQIGSVRIFNLTYPLNNFETKEFENGPEFKDVYLKNYLPKNIENLFKYHIFSIKH